MNALLLSSKNLCRIRRTARTGKSGFALCGVSSMTRSCNHANLESDERAYLDRQRGFMLRNIHDATGLAPEVRAEGIAMLDPCGDLSDIAFPEEGTEGHLTLLIAEFLADWLRQ